MEWLVGIPEWFVWLAVGSFGVVALLLCVNALEVALDLEPY